MIESLLLHLHALSQPSLVALTFAVFAVAWALIERCRRLYSPREVWPDAEKRLRNLGPRDSRLVREAEELGRGKR